MPKVLVLILNLLLLFSLLLNSKSSTLKKKWFYFSIFWSFVFFALLYISLLFVLNSTDFEVGTDFLAFIIIPLFFLINSYDRNLEIVIKVVKFLLFLNFIVITAEIFVGDFLIAINQFYWLSLVGQFIPSEMSYPTIRAFFGVYLLRPMGVFSNIHVSGFILFLYFVYLYLQPHQKRWLMILVVFDIILSVNLQITLCLAIFLALCYIPQKKLIYKLSFILVIIIMLSPMYYFYNPKKTSIDSPKAIWQITLVGIDRMSNEVFLFGTQLNPHKIRDEHTFTSRHGLRKLGTIYDSGLYTLLIRSGILGIAVSVLFCLHLCYMFERKKRRIVFAIVTSTCVTVIHYPVFLSAYGSFFFCILLLTLDRLNPEDLGLKNPADNLKPSLICST